MIIRDMTPDASHASSGVVREQTLLIRRNCELMTIIIIYFDYCYNWYFAYLYISIYLNGEAQPLNIFLVIDINIYSSN